MGKGGSQEENAMGDSEGCLEKRGHLIQNVGLGDSTVSE